MTDRDIKQYQESKIQAAVPNIPCVRILLPTRPKDDKEISAFYAHPPLFKSLIEKCQRSRMSVPSVQVGRGMPGDFVC